MSYILEGNGTLTVDDTISHYQKGDTLAIGGNLPHLFKSEPNASVKSHMLTLFFTKQGFGEQFFDLEELSEINAFFNKIDNGFKVLSHHKSLSESFLNIKDNNKLGRFIIFLQILKTLTKAKKQPLSSYTYGKNYSADEGK